MKVCTKCLKDSTEVEFYDNCSKCVECQKSSVKKYLKNKKQLYVCKNCLKVVHSKDMDGSRNCPQCASLFDAISERVLKNEQYRNMPKEDRVEQTERCKRYGKMKDGDKKYIKYLEDEQAKKDKL